MAQETAISWTDLSWNPTHGCSKVSPGCAHCYAETLSRRYRQTTSAWTPANAGENVILKPHKIREPLSGAKAWQGLGAAAAAAGKTEGKLVFVNSMSDLFHDQVPDGYIASVFAVMALAPQHTFQVLTKRPERMQRLLSNPGFHINALLARWRLLGIDEPAARARFIAEHPEHAISLSCPRPLPNVWMGVSIENRRYVHRADLLRETPAAVRFISAEPLLGPLLFDDRVETIRSSDGGVIDCWSDGFDGPDLDLTGIDWLIAGGESGPGHRPMHEDWVRDLRVYCQHTRHLFDPNTGQRGPGTAFFLKQMGGARPGDRLEDLPEDLRVREFPQVPA